MKRGPLNTFKVQEYSTWTTRCRKTWVGERVSNYGKHGESNRLLLQDGTSNISYYKVIVYY